MKVITILIALIVSGCTNHLYEVNKRINAYHYSYNGKSGTKTPAQFYADGGGSCVDFARTKQAELGGEIVILIPVYKQDNHYVNHAVLKVNGWLLDSEFNEIRLAALEKTYPYVGRK